MALIKVNKKDYMEGDTKYSRAISIPQYEVKGDRPFIEELYSNEKVMWEEDSTNHRLWKSESSL